MELRGQMPCTWGWQVPEAGVTATEAFHTRGYQDMEALPGGPSTFLGWAGVAKEDGSMGTGRAERG